MESFSRKLIIKGIDSFRELSLSCVSKSFPGYDNDIYPSSNLLLNNINLSIGSGDIIGLVGETGVGKTTLGKIISGLIHPDNGKVMLGRVDLFGCDERDMTHIRKWIRYAPQNPDAVLFPNMTVRESLKESDLYTRLNSDEKLKWHKFLESGDYYDSQWLNRSFKCLSLGQRRRVINLRAIQACPKFVVYDEPFNGLDNISKKKMLDLLRLMSADWAIGIMIISHDLDTMRNICDKIWLLESGTLSPFSTETVNK
jgi:ABC-type glutathione transport system ATPase component